PDISAPSLHAALPILIADYGRWVGASVAGEEPTMVFQVLPLAAEGREYTLAIDGQQMRYRNTPPQWHTFQLPGQGVPGVQISARSEEHTSELQSRENL